MGTLFTGFPVKKVAISVLCGIAISLVSWFYLNSYYTLSVEDDLFTYETFLKKKVLNNKPKNDKQFVFISTGKDLNLVDDTAGYGNIPVSDRYKLFKLMQAINRCKAKPRFILFDLQFYYPYTSTVDERIDSLAKANHIDGLFPIKAIDDSLQAEITAFGHAAISVIFNNNKIDTPLYKAAYGIADYQTYGATVNKFRLNYSGINAVSMPVLMHRKIDGAVYTGGRFATFCNSKLIFNYVWPAYYYNEERVKNNSAYQLYHIGSLLPLLGSTQAIETIFKNKVVFVGNFEDDVHDTPDGKVPGTIVLANLYLGLLNGTHVVPWLWALLLLASFSGLSYVALYNKLPEINFRFRFKLANRLITFLGEYISYITILMLLSLLSVIVFDINVSLFLPAFIFSAIDSFSTKAPKT